MEHASYFRKPGDTEGSGGGSREGRHAWEQLSKMKVFHFILVSELLGELVRKADPQQLPHLQSLEQLEVLSPFEGVGRELA